MDAGFAGSHPGIYRYPIQQLVTFHDPTMVRLYASDFTILRLLYCERARIGWRNASTVSFEGVREQDQDNHQKFEQGRQPCTRQVTLRGQSGQRPADGQGVQE